MPVVACVLMLFRAILGLAVVSRFAGGKLEEASSTFTTFVWIRRRAVAIGAGIG